MKKLLVVFLILVTALVIVLLAKDAIIKASVENGVRMATGMELKMDSFRFSVLKQQVTIRGLRLLNPAAFPDRTMIEIPNIYVEYDLPSIIGGKIHLPQVHLDLKELVVVKNSKGDLNLNALKTVQAHKDDKAPAEKTPRKAADIKIDVLKLGIGKVIYKDYSAGDEPRVQEFNINLNETYSDINNPQTLVNMIVLKALMSTSIATLTNFDLQGLKGAVGGVLSGAQKTASKVAESAQETVAATKEKAQDALKQTADAMKGLLKEPLDAGK